MGVFYGVAALGLELIPPLQEGDFLVGIDGGLSSLQKNHLQPDLIVGDFDSLGYLPSEGNVHALPCQKDDTDLAYALKHGISLGYRDFFVQGCLGGRLDHSMGNFQLLSGLAREGMRGIFLGEGQGALCICNGSVEFPIGFEGYCSVFAINEDATGVFLENLAYTGENLTLTPTIPLGVSNQFLPDKRAQISVKEGCLMILWQSQKGDYFSLLNGISYPSTNVVSTLSTVPDEPNNVTCTTMLDLSENPRNG